MRGAVYSGVAFHARLRKTLVTTTAIETDTDGDGLTNLKELRAGIYPRSARSSFRVISAARSGGDVSLVFSSVGGKIYRIEARDILLGSWIVLRDQAAATRATTALTDFGGTIVPRRAYRISVEP